MPLDRDFDLPFRYLINNYKAEQSTISGHVYTKEDLRCSVFDGEGKEQHGRGAWLPITQMPNGRHRSQNGITQKNSQKANK